MSRKNPFKIFPQRNKGNHSAPSSSLHQPLPSSSSESPRVPQINITDPPIPRDHDNTHSDRHGTTGQAVPSIDRDSESLMGRVFERARRKLSPNRSRPSTPNLVEPSRPARPLQLSANDAILPSFPLARGENIDNSHETSPSYATHDNGLSVHAQLEREDTSVPPLSEHTVTPSASSGSDRKNVIIGATRLVLQNAASALKFAPFPNLDAIPNLLLKWLDVYETVGGNDESLKGLDDDIRKAYDTVLEPLALSTEPIPDEVVVLIKRFHSALEEQKQRIDALNNQGSVKRTILAPEISTRISDVKACINDAVNNFSTQTSTLTLLLTIKASVRSELKRLGGVAAGHTYVKSKSECLPSTRDSIQKLILNHLRDANNQFVWLRGSPGTGKTAISLSIASTLKAEGTLAASFFWDKNQKGTGLDSLKLFPSTLARQLALFSANFKVSLIKSLRRPEMELFLELSLEEQMRTLIIEPMSDLKGVLSGGDKRFAIILDGLDECGGLEELDSLMKLMLLLRELPSPFAVLFSCRPESIVLSAWTRAQDQGLVIPYEDVDRIELDTLRTIRCMVDEGFHDFIKDSPAWKPSDEDLDVFARGCRGLPIMASTRIREAQSQIRYYGSSLKLEFEYLRNLNEIPMDLKSEYLRIMRRAYMRNSSSIRQQVAKNYRKVVGILVAASWSDLGTDDISQLLGIAEDEVRSTLRPISSIVDLPSDNKQTVKFYHATAKEFITGNPIGEKQDEVFFIHDVKGHSIGLRLLQFINDVIQTNEFGIPTELPLGDRKKWELFQSKQKPRVVENVFSHLFSHLDPSLLFSQESNELQRGFERFLSNNLLLFYSWPQNTRVVMWSVRVWVEWNSSAHNHKSMALVREAINLIGRLGLNADPWHVYRSGLPFTPLSSPLYEIYGHLSDSVRVFSVSGEFSGGFIPLSEGARVAQEIMKAKQTELPKKLNEHDGEETNYEAEFAEHGVRNGIVTSAAISQNGSYVALGFGNGVIEVANIDDQHIISRFQCNPPKHPVWIEFIHGDNVQIATEDTDGNIMILGPGTSMTKLGTLPSGCFPAVTAVSNNGSFIIRVPQNLGQAWYENMALIRFSGKPSIQLLASPSTPSPVQSPQSHSDLSIPQRHTVRFSPGGRYVGAYDRNCAFIWSTDSHNLWIAQYRVQNFKTWIFNMGLEPPCLHDIPMPVLRNPTLPLILEDGATHPPSTEPDLGHNADESWLKHPFYDLSPSIKSSEDRVIEFYSSAMGRIPLTVTPPCIWFNGEVELVVPFNYRSIERTENSFSEKEAWYGDVILKGGDGGIDSHSVYFPRASKDGTRFLLQGKLKAPVVVDISQVV